MSSMFSSECEVLETASCPVSITTGQPSPSPLTGGPHLTSPHLKLWYFSECAIFTWFDSSHPTFPQSCFLYSRWDNSTVSVPSVDPPLSPGAAKLWRWLTPSQVRFSHIGEVDIADHHYYQGPPPVWVARKWPVRVPTIITLVSRFVISDNLTTIYSLPVST